MTIAPWWGDFEADLLTALDLADPDARRASVEALVKDIHRDRLGRFASGGGSSAGGEVRDSIASAGTLSEVGKATAAEIKRITGRDVPVDFDGLHPDVAKHHAEGILRGLERLPKTDLRGVSTFGPDSVLGHSTFGNKVQDGSFAVTTSFRGRSGSTIWINTRYAHSLDEYREAMADGDTVRHLSGRPGDLTRIGTHELGHAYAKSVRNNLIVDQAVDISIDQAHDAGSSVSAYVHGQISRYAATGGGTELFAEAVADVVSNGSGASGLSRDIVESAEAHFDEWRY